MNQIFKFLLVFLFLSGCQKIQSVSDMITQPTPREVYEREFLTDHPKILAWLEAFEKAKTSRLEIELPFELNALTSTIENSIVSYRFELKQGDRLLVESHKTIDTLNLFIDLFKFENDSILEFEAVATKEQTKNTLTYAVERTDVYQLIIQSEIVDSILPFQILIYTQPSYQFPVVGKENSAIQSFWGAPREGGKRSHEGVDIFANRGTPIVAITKGIVSSTGNRGLGGKQVWLRDGVFGKSIYYAHLDSIAVKRGRRVNVGDTLGFVGNTGNAKYTKPHLHFGIYGSGGAIDPLPFIKLRNVPILNPERLVTKGKTGLRQNQLRLGASTKYQKLATLPKDESLDIIGKTKQWYHVKLKDSLEGFMHQSLVLPSL